MGGIVFGGLFILTLSILTAYCIQTKRRQTTEVIKTNATLKNAPDSIQFIPDLPRATTAGGPEGGGKRTTSEGQTTITGLTSTMSNESMYGQEPGLNEMTTMGLQMAEIEEKDEINLDTSEDESDDVHQIYDEQQITPQGFETVK